MESDKIRLITNNSIPDYKCIKIVLCISDSRIRIGALYPRRME